MLLYVESDLLTSPAQVLVNTVNTVGVMGKGLAKQFRQAYPDMFVAYQKLCETGQFDVGQLWLYKTPTRWVLNFPTKRHWRQPSRLEYIEAGLQNFALTYDQRQISSISFPMLGCGNGGLAWDDVRPLMERHLKPLPIRMYVHLYRDGATPEFKTPHEMRIWLQGEPQSLAFDTFWEDLQALLAEQITFPHAEGGAPFTARPTMLDEAEPGVLFTTPDGSFAVAQQQWLSWWQYVRGSGFGAPWDFPFGLDQHAPHVVGLVTQLPYVNAVHLTSPTLDTFGRDRVGVQLRTPAQKPAPPLEMSLPL